MSDARGGDRFVVWLAVALSLLAFSTALAVAVNTEGGPLSDAPRPSELAERLERMEQKLARLERVVGPSQVPTGLEGGAADVAPPRSRLDLRITMLEQELQALEQRLAPDPARERLERMLREERTRRLREERAAAATAVRETVLDSSVALRERVDAFRRLIEAGVPATEPVLAEMLTLLDGAPSSEERVAVALAFDGVRDEDTIAGLRERVERESDADVAAALRVVLEALEIVEGSD